MWALELFTEAVVEGNNSKNFSHAENIASLLAEPFKSVAREIWQRWVSIDCPF